jgi:2-C-methyl-D-erythritol 2,4-cyclodiphosphate synthase
MKIRVGQGFDVHQLEHGKELWLGGIKLEAEKGATGHSDADVLLHAVCDALLGAAGMRDIGFHFKNTDLQWKGADSKIFLKEVVRMLKENNWSIGNVDCTIVLEHPKINPHIEKMRETIAPIMEIAIEDVSIKATTNETMGYVGRGEGICSHAVALIQKG